MTNEKNIYCSTLLISNFLCKGYNTHP